MGILMHQPDLALFLPDHKVLPAGVLRYIKANTNWLRDGWGKPFIVGIMSEGKPLAVARMTHYFSDVQFLGLVQMISLEADPICDLPRGVVMVTSAAIYVKV